MLADTFVKIIVTAVIAGIMLAVWRSWREPLMVAIPLILEASVFITVTWIVGRPRPDVPRLEESPVDSSFPSGHTAAAAAYSAIAVVVFWRFRNVWVRTAVVVLVVAIPIIVGGARVYAGMHYLTDVVAGVLLGLASVFVVWLVLRHRQAPADDVSLTLIVLLLAALAGVVAFAGSATKKLDPIDPAPEEQAVVRSLARHPRVDRFLRERFDRRTRGGFMLTVCFLIVLAVAVVLGLLLDMIDAGSGLAELDDSVAEWGAEHATSTAVDVLEVITHLGGTTGGHRRAG